MENTPNLSETTAIQPYIKMCFKHLEKRFNSEGGISGIVSGFGDLDAITNGFQPGELVIIASATQMGKTSMALNIIEWASADPRNKQKVASVIFSLDMTGEQVTMSFLCSIGKVNASRIRKGDFHDSDWPRLQRAASALFDSKMFIEDARSITIQDLCAKARHLKNTEDIQIVCVDGLQLLAGWHWGQDHKQREYYINLCLSDLKNLAVELQVPIIVTSWVNVDLTKRGYAPPILSDLASVAGEAANITDTVLFVHRDSVFCESCNRQDGSCLEGHERVAEIIIAKHPDGPGVVKLVFYGEYSRFESFYPEA